MKNTKAELRSMELKNSIIEYEKKNYILVDIVYMKISFKLIVEHLFTFLRYIITLVEYIQKTKTIIKWFRVNLWIDYYY